MAVPRTLVQLGFGAGIDESQRSETVDPATSFPVIENARQDQYGVLSKRLGYGSLAKLFLDNTSRTAGYRMLMNGDQLCVIDGTNLDVAADTLDVSIVKGRVPEATYRVLEAPAPHLTNVIDGDGDTATVEGQGGTYVVLARRVLTATGAHAAYVCLLDAANGAVILPTTKLQESSTVTPKLTVRLATYGSRVLAFVCDGTANTIKTYVLNTSSRSTISSGWSLVGTLASDYKSQGCAVNLIAPSTASVAVAYVNNGVGTSRITVCAVSATGGFLSTTINTSSVTPDALSLSEGSSTLWVAWNENLTVKACGLNESTFATTATTASIITITTNVVLAIQLGPRSGGSAVVYAYNSGLSTRMRAIKASGGATATDGSEAMLANAVIQSRPFLRNGRLYAHFSSENKTEMILCDCTPDTSAASSLTTWLRPVCAPIQREVFAASGTRTPQIASSNKYLHGFTVKASGTTFAAKLVEYDFANAFRWKPAALNGSTLLSGGVTSVFDGSRIFEENFLVRPTPPLSYSTGSAGSLTFSVGRMYVLTYEDVDADGNWHVSGVSDPGAFTGVLASNLSEVRVRPLSITSRGFTTNAIHTSDQASGTRIVLWGTLDGGNPPYYRLGEVVNDPNDDEIVYADDTFDSTLQTRALLYGTGNLPGTGASQDHRAPPGLLYHVTYNGMLVGSSGRTIWHSAQPIDGEGTWFSPIFTQQVDEDITGLAVQDGSVIIFSRNGAWVTAGDPPSDNGLQGGLSTPRKLAVDLGCIDAGSIVTTNTGTFYQSARGIELLTRGQTNVFIGDKVQDTLAAYPIVSAAVLDTKNGLVRFSLAASRTDGVVSAAGRDLVFDLQLQIWVSVDRKRGSSADEASQDACVAYVEGAWRYCWLATNGNIYYERALDDASAYTDVTTWITLAVETGSIKVSGLQGRQSLNRALFLERKTTDHDLSFALAYNYETAFRTSRTWTKTEINALLSSGWPITQLKHDPHDDAECQSVRVRLSDATPTGGTVGTGKGATWLALTLDITPRPGAFEVPEEAA